MAEVRWCSRCGEAHPGRCARGSRALQRAALLGLTTLGLGGCVAMYGAVLPHTEPVRDFDGDGYTFQQGDCNDADPAIFPGAEELPGDGIDSDCDGLDDPVDDSGDTDEA